MSQDCSNTECFGSNRQNWRQCGTEDGSGIELLHIAGTVDADIKVRVSKDGKVCAEVCKNDMLLRSGLNYIGFDINIDNPELWWPNGMGEQPLYTIEVWGESRGDVFHGRPLNMEYVP